MIDIVVRELVAQADHVHVIGFGKCSSQVATDFEYAARFTRDRSQEIRDLHRLSLACAVPAQLPVLP